MSNVIAKMIISDKDNKTETRNVTIQILKNNEVVQEWSGPVVSETITETRGKDENDRI